MSSSQNEALHQLQSEQLKLLDGIDELRTLGVGGLVELPQLIVCGNQSSGKSSVLEAISRVQFPAKSSLCTRFATEVILRRRPSSHVKVSIEPGPSRKDEQEKKNLRAFAPESFAEKNDLPNLIKQAKACMGISDSTNASFSDDVLKVEISGPDKPELTLVDLPGLYYSTSQDQSAQGMDIVHSLTERYMKNTRSIILAVISAKADYHVQKVLNIAERFDPQRERTLGIITQSDIPEANSDEQEAYLKFVKNEKVHLQLGWHALRNRSFETQKDTHEERDEREKSFFKQGRWASVPRESVGIDSLRSRLSNVLLKHIRRNLPELIADIHGKVLDRQQKLGKLGAPRSSLQQQKGFLLNISSNFEKITGQALNGMYSDDFFGGFDQKPYTQDFRRLRALVRELNEYFAEAMEIGGSRRWIHEFCGKAPPENPTNPYLDGWTPKLVDRHVLEREVAESARKNRGIELPGSANQLLVGSLFRDQSKPWEEIAERHLITTWESVRYFVFLALQHLTDEHTCSLLGTAFVEPELNKIKEKLLEKLSELTSYTKRGHPLPVGQSFLTRIQNSRNERQLRKLKGALQGPFLGPDQKFGLNDLEKALSTLKTSSDEFAATDIIDEMQAYYDTAIVTFVDNIATLAIENCLLGPLESILTSQAINNMDDTQIQELAAEPSFIREERDRLNSEMGKLQAGLRTFASFNVHKPSVPSFATKSVATMKAPALFDPSKPSSSFSQPSFPKWFSSTSTPSAHGTPGAEKQSASTKTSNQGSQMAFGSPPESKKGPFGNQPFIKQKPFGDSSSNVKWNGFGGNSLFGGNSSSGTGIGGTSYDARQNPNTKKSSE